MDQESRNYNREDKEISGGVRPKQAVCAEIVVHPAFQPDHGYDCHPTEGGEGAEPGACITDVVPHYIQRERYSPSLAEASGQQVDQTPRKIGGWAPGSE